MKLVVGLGNPGSEFVRSRHNVGWMVVDEIKRLGGLKNVIIGKNDTFMNDSGISVKKLVEKHKIPLENLLIINDDLDLDFGKYKLQKGRGAAGHHGVESIISELGTQDFWRLRIGIGRPLPEKGDFDDYVIKEMPEEQREALLKMAESDFLPQISFWISF
jgi:PTH1 family peptidyl-tRNA hydrolase